MKLMKVRGRIYKLIAWIIVFALMAGVSAVAEMRVTSDNATDRAVVSPLELIFSHDSGWYKNAFDLEFACNYHDAKIYYTADGSEPDFENNTATICYDSEKKVRIYDKFNFLNNYSTMNFAWGAPYVKATEYQPKSTTVKAFAVRVDKETGEEIERTKTITKTYFVDKELSDKYGVKVVSITGNPEDFFGDGKGKLGFLTNSSQNPDNVDAHVQMFDENGKQIIDQDINIKLHGAYSRSFNQKTFRLRADEDYDAEHNKFEYQFFGGVRDINGKKISKFKRLLTRNAGNDCNNAMLRDAFTSRLVDKMGFGVLASEPAVVYLFDEFYGLCHLRERYDDHYINDHYNIEREDAVVITTHGFQLNEGRPGIDDRDWLNLVSFVNRSNMSDSENYKVFEEQVDVDSYINYCIAQLYIANTDWTNNNTRIWRSARVHTDEDEDTYGIDGTNYNDGRWRYLWYDTDISSGVFHPHNSFGGQPTTYNFDSIEYLNMVSAGGTGFDLLHLLESRTFRKRFVDLYINHINTTFLSSRVNNVLDEISAPMRKAMPYEIDRFGMIKNMETWEENLKKIKSFFKPRGNAVIKQLDKRWGIGEEYTLTLDRIDGRPDDFSVMGVELEPVMLQDGKWSGKYYSVNTVELECDLSNGEKFGAWEITDSNGTRRISSEKLYLDLRSDTVVKVVYASELPTPTPEPTPEMTATPKPTLEPTTTPADEITAVPTTVEPTSTPTQEPTLEPTPDFSTTEPSPGKNCFVMFGGRIKYVKEGTSLESLPSPKKDGQTFLGWYADASFANKVDFPILVENNMVLHAKFGKNPAAVKKKNIKVSVVFGEAGEVFYKIRWKLLKKGRKIDGKKVKYCVEASLDKKSENFKPLAALKEKAKFNITLKKLKKAKVYKADAKLMSRKFYIRVVSAVKRDGVWCKNYSKKLRL